MIIYILKKFFKILIGDLSLTERAMFWNRFNTLMADVAEAVAKGAVEGLKK